MSEALFDALVSHRTERWEVWVLDAVTEEFLYVLDGVKDGVFDFSVFDEIRSGGTIEIDPTRSDVDWAHVKIQPWYTPLVDVIDPWPIGVFIPGTPVVDYTETGATAAVELYDKLLDLVRDATESTWTFDTGANAIESVITTIESVGETKIRIDASAEVLASPMVWEAGTSKLRIVNDLLSAAGYFSIGVDGQGFMFADPYKPPNERGIQWDFVDDPSVSIYAPQFTNDKDYFSVPNKVVLVGQSEDGSTAPPIGTAADEDPASPWSYANRNNRWITVTEFDRDATSETILGTLAARRLLELQQVSSTFDIQHALIPLPLNSVVRFRNEGRINVNAVVQKSSIRMGTGELVRTRLREVSQ